MGFEAILAVALLIAASAGSYRQGKRSTAMETVQLLEIQINLLVEKNTEKDGKIATLEGRVNVLSDLVTQRAEVEVVHTELMTVKECVERIAAKVGA